jgi:transposase InsO family protein
MRFAFIQEHRSCWPVKVTCRVLRVSRSGFYAWCRRAPSDRAQRREVLGHRIREVHEQSRATYGSPRVHRSLVAQGESVCENTVAKVMNSLQIKAKTAKAFVPCTTDSDHHAPVAPNTLGRDFDASLPNHKWVADITYIPTAEGWLYLSVVLDLCSRRVVGWAMADHMRSELISDALEMALAHRRPARGLLHHSDRGVQYASDAYQGLLAEHGIECSMSRRGNCYDNAVMESFFGTLKTELVHHEHYTTRSQASGSIFEYIEVFYNRQRLHSTLGYLSPEAFEAGLN